MKLTTKMTPVLLGWVLIVFGPTLGLGVQTRRGLSKLDFPDATINMVFVTKEAWQEANEVHVIRDEEKILELVRLFRDNRRGPPAPCGYHISLWFQYEQAGLSNVYRIAYNLECSVMDYELHAIEIDSLMKEYAERVTHNPTHFLVRMKIDGRESPRSVYDALQRDGNLVLSKDPTYGLPYVDLDMTASGANSCRARIDRVLDQLQDIEVSEVEMVSSTPSNCRARVHFPHGTDVRRVCDDLEEVEILRIVVPSYYVLYYVSKAPYTRDLRERLLKENPFILDLTDQMMGNWQTDRAH